MKLVSRNALGTIAVCGRECCSISPFVSIDASDLCIPVKLIKEISQNRELSALIHATQAPKKHRKPKGSMYNYSRLFLDVWAPKVYTILKGSWDLATRVIFKGNYAYNYL